MKSYPDDQRGKIRPKGSFNINAHFIAPNPRTSFNIKSIRPLIDTTAYVGPFSSIIGDVTIGKNVFIAPNVSIRADEGTPFFIDSCTNIQDGVILHGLVNGRVMEGNIEYSIFIGKHVSCAHGCIIHGPCKIGDNVFIGFHSIVLNAIIGTCCYISHNALVTGGIKVAPNRFVPAGAIIDTQAKADMLRPVPQSQEEFAQEVQHINNEFPDAYSLMFGATKCSCGLSCDPATLKAVLR
ncbi:MAG: Carbonate dehydratase [Herbinix sp.]|jgi:carbon dioxide concentrating mechanism protein CcmM|nr:Carbonate dehydratase [Herbinix sp.]